MFWKKALPNQHHQKVIQYHVLVYFFSFSRCNLPSYMVVFLVSHFPAKAT